MILYESQVNTERAIRHAIQERLPIVVVVNKVNIHFLMLKSRACISL